MQDLLANPAVRLFAVCYLILVIKMMAVGTYTSTVRIRRRVFATPEDYKLQGMSVSEAADEDIERARRAHRNDLENILPFLGVGLIYALTNPSTLGAQINFIGFTVARVLHSVFYILQMQPHRTLVFMAGAVLMLWMVIASLVSLLGA
jgi:uncharacterized MAPEG superfamily protein